MKRRHATVALNVAFATVIGGDRIPQIAVESVLKVLEVAHAGVHVLLWIVQILSSQPVAGPRHELHQTLCTDGRTSCRMESRLCLNHRRDQGRIDVVFLRLLVNQVAEWDRIRKKVLPDHAVDSSHFCVKQILLLLRDDSGGGLSHSRQPLLVEQGNLARDDALRKGTGNFEH